MQFLPKQEWVFFYRWEAYVDNVDHETGEKYTKYGHAKSVT